MYIALRIENGPAIVNGESKIEYSGIFKAAGTDIFYYRRRIIMNKDAGEGFFIKGPISEPIVLQVTCVCHLSKTRTYPGQNLICDPLGLRGDSEMRNVRELPLSQGKLQEMSLIFYILTRYIRSC
jgi:hypothetical protein